MIREQCLAALELMQVLSLFFHCLGGMVEEQDLEQKPDPGCSEGPSPWARGNLVRLLSLD